MGVFCSAVRLPNPTILSLSLSLPPLPHSHPQVFLVTITQGGGGDALITSQLALVDLAGDPIIITTQSTALKINAAV